MSMTAIYGQNWYKMRNDLCFQVSSAFKPQLLACINFRELVLFAFQFVMMRGSILEVYAVSLGSTACC